MQTYDKNIIFFGIEEMDLQEGKYENAENTLHIFIKDNMKIQQKKEL